MTVLAEKLRNRMYDIYRVHFPAYSLLTKPSRGVFFWHMLYQMITRRVMCTKKTRWGISQKFLNITKLQIWRIAWNASGKLRGNVCQYTSSIVDAYFL